MKLNSISVGGGLALVAVGLLANAAASLVGTPDRTANADDLKRAAKSPQSVADVAVSSADEMRRAMDGTPPMMPMGGGDGCVEGEPLNWFGELRELPPCAADGGALFLTVDFENYQDINQDGESEGLEIVEERLVVEGSVLPVHCVGALETTEVIAGEVVVTQRCVLDSARFQEILQSLGFVPWAASASFYGWRDMDGDGDRDSIIFFRAVSDALPGSFSKFYWLENTGFEKPQFAAGDINRDGQVDGVDISILLSDWTY